MHTHVEFVKKVIAQAEFVGPDFSFDQPLSVDSRSVAPGDIFVALVGQKVDGHDFTAQALKQGATGFMFALHRKQELLQKYGAHFEGKSLIFVPDTLQALIDIAHAWRMQFTCPVIAITGSVGKTTTKEMVRNILQCAQMPHVVSQGNQNTLVGVSINILKMRAHHEAGVFEVGIGQRGDMKKLMQLLRPTSSVITAVGHGHMQGLGDLQSISKEKREVFSHFASDNIGVINGDQRELADISYAHPVIRFGKKTTNQIQARKIVCQNNTISFTAKIYKDRFPVTLATCLATRVTNALAAMTVGYLLSIAPETLVQGVQMPIHIAGRFQMLPHEATRCLLIHDGYNANPDSIKASLAAFDQLVIDKKKILVLADMLELAGSSLFWHRQLGRMIGKVRGLTHVVLIGTAVQATKKTIPLGIKSTLFEQSDQAVESLKSMLLAQNSVFLFKGSQSMNLSLVVKKLQEVA